MSESMKRRDFLTTSLTAAGVAAMPTAAALAMQQQAPPAAAAPVQREFYELRRYVLRMGPMQQHMDKYVQNALIPAMARQKVGPIGVFSVLVGNGNPSLYVLIPHASFDSMMRANAALGTDPEYAAANNLRTLPATDPGYADYERTLHQAVDFMPKLEPAPGGTQSPRIFELRMYRTPGVSARRKKAEMFSPVGGELAIFRRVGLTPVMFSETVFGPDLPNLTYMLTYPDLATREKNWTTFANDPEWKKLSSTQGYTNPEIMASINNVLLRPTGYSQL